MKPYCTQNEGNCETCSLSNYGKDCMNNKIEQEPEKESKKETI